jgi:hypothetical protein
LKSDLLNAWCKRTGEPLPEARHRIRSLAEAGMLPTWYHPVSYEDLARLLLGFVASVQHKDAPEAVQRFSEFRCGMRGIGHEAAPLMEAFKDKPLLEALTTALKPEFWVMSVEANVTRDWCRLDVMRRPKHVGWVSAQTAALDQAAGGTPGTLHLLFTDPAALPLPATVHPLEIKRSVPLPLILHLLTDLLDHPPIGESEDAASPARETAPFESQGHVRIAHDVPGTLTRPERSAPADMAATATMRSQPTCTPTVNSSA